MYMGLKVDRPLGIATVSVLILYTDTHNLIVIAI